MVTFWIILGCLVAGGVLGVLTGDGRDRSYDVVRGTMTALVLVLIAWMLQ